MNAQTKKRGREIHQNIKDSCLRTVETSTFLFFLSYLYCSCFFTVDKIK